MVERGIAGVSMDMYSSRETLPKVSLFFNLQLRKIHLFGSLFLAASNVDSAVWLSRSRITR